MKFPSPYTDITFSKVPKYKIKDEVTFFHESWFTAKALCGKIIGISRKIATGNIGYLVICPDKHNVISIDEDEIISHECSAKE